MPKKKRIIMNPQEKPSFCKKEALRLSDFLNVKITTSQVLDEVLLYELGMEPVDVVLSCYIIKDIENGVKKS